MSSRARPGAVWRPACAPPPPAASRTSTSCVAASTCSAWSATSQRTSSAGLARAYGHKLLVCPVCHLHFGAVVLDYKAVQKESRDKWLASTPTRMECMSQHAQILSTRTCSPAFGFTCTRLNAK